MVMPSESNTLVYVVDDDPAVLHSTRFLLESAGHRVETFASGPELLAAFSGLGPAVVLLDQVMPGMDGLEVFGRLRDLAPCVPVVLITGHPDPASGRGRGRAPRASPSSRNRSLPTRCSTYSPATGPAWISTLRLDRPLPGRQPAAGLRGRGGSRGNRPRRNARGTACAFPVPAGPGC